MLLLVFTGWLAAEEELKIVPRIGLDPVLRGVWRLHIAQKEGEEEESFDPPLEFATAGATTVTLASGFEIKLLKVSIMQRGDATPANIAVTSTNQIWQFFKPEGESLVLVSLYDMKLKPIASWVISVAQ
jgi:hypothetical protein